MQKQVIDRFYIYFILLQQRFQRLRNIEESKSKNLYEIKNSLSDKNIIYENNLEDFVDGPDEIEALKRLNKAYDKYEKQNLGIINE